MRFFPTPPFPPVQKTHVFCLQMEKPGPEGSEFMLEKPPLSSKTRTWAYLLAFFIILNHEPHQKSPRPLLSPPPPSLLPFFPLLLSSSLSFSQTRFPTSLIYKDGFSNPLGLPLVKTRLLL